jgi:hypothetical protein
MPTVKSPFLSSLPNLQVTQRIGQQFQIHLGGVRFVSVNCNPDEVAVGGGYNVGGIDKDLRVTNEFNPGNRWGIRGENYSTDTGTFTPIHLPVLSVG